MSTRLSIQEALKRVHLNTVTLKNEENARFIKALQNNIKPRDQISNFLEKVLHRIDSLFYQYIGLEDKEIKVVEGR